MSEIKKSDLIKALESTQKWHKERVEVYEKLLDDESDQLTIKDGSEVVFVLTGEQLKGFKAGVSVALNSFKELPFKVAKAEPKQEGFIVA